MEAAVGSILEGKVANIVKYGAFVTLPDGRSGLVHISEIANTFVSDVHDFLQEGDAVKVKVLSLENGRINLSIKKALPSAPPNDRRTTVRTGSAQHPAAGSGTQSQPASVFQESTLPPSGDPQFEDRLKQFLTASKGKMADLNRNIDGKRGGHRRK